MKVAQLMTIDRVAARWVIVLLVVAGLAWVEASLHAHHYYRLTYEVCNSGANGNLLCIGWQREAWYSAIVVLALGAAALIWNERRSTK
jgi:hypothetical protein